MTLDLSPLNTVPRLLIEATLQPVQGTRFQPTGFPNLGAAEYAAPDGDGKMLLVESAQSMANRLEAVCWDEAKGDNGDLVESLSGLPYVSVKNGSGVWMTNSILEAHRLNSVYIEDTDWFETEFASSLNYKKKGKSFERDVATSVNFRTEVYPTLLRFDPGTLIHGVFLESIAGIIRVPRSISAFIEAEGVKVAASGGVKNDRVSAKKSENKTAGEGYGNVPYARDEWTAKTIKAYFNLDLQQIRAFALGDAATALLIGLSLFKIRRFLENGLRLRTACDLDLVDGGLKVTRPKTWSLPTLPDLEAALPGLIKAVAAEGKFAGITKVTYRK